MSTEQKIQTVNMNSGYMEIAGGKKIKPNRDLEHIARKVTKQENNKKKASASNS